MNQIPETGSSGRLRTLREYLIFDCGLGLLAGISFLWTLLALPLNLILPRKWKTLTGRIIITMGFRMYLWALSGMGACHFNLQALDILQNDSPMIIAPNHPSMLDALMVISRLPNLACILKSELVNNLFFGAGARLAGYIRNDSLRKMIRLATEDLRGGSHLLLFPEGTRTTRLPIGTVHGSIALIAKEAKVPIQTVFIETDSAFLTKGWSFFRKPSMPIHYRIRLGKRFAPPSDVRGFTVELERYFESAMTEVPFPPLYPTEAERQ